MRLCAVLLSAVSSVMMIGGCGQPGPVADIAETVTASGVLTYQGKPLDGYNVMLTPVSGLRAAVGTTGADGRFELGTNDAGDGAEPGQHRVSVVWSGGGAGDDGLGEVIDDPSKLPKAPVQLPAKYASPEASGIVVTIPAEGTEDLKIELQ